MYESEAKLSPFASFLKFVIFSFCFLLFLLQAVHVSKFYSNLSFSESSVNTHLNFSKHIALPAFSICLDIEPQALTSFQADTIFRKFFEDAETKEKISCILMSSKLSLNGFNNTVKCEELFPIVESINYGSSLKCLTYLSKLKLNQIRDYSKNRNNQITWSVESYDTIKFEINFPMIKEQFPEKLDKRAFIYLHQDNELPVDGFKMSKMIPGFDYIITFNAIVEQRSFECKNYYDEQTNDFSQYDCIDKCLIDIFRNNCGCLPINITIRRDMVYFLGSFCEPKGCESIETFQIEKCKEAKHCQFDCNREIFNFITESIPNSLNLEQKPKPTTDTSGIYSYDANEYRPQHYRQNDIIADPSSNQISVLIQSNHLPVIIYQHQNTFNSFEVLFKILILATVWLGVSVFTIIWFPFNLVHRFLTSRFCISDKCKTKPLIDVK